MASTALKVAIFAIIIYCTRIYMGGGTCKSTARIDGKVAIVTGANTGIGKETAKDLVRRGGRVILACRSLERGNKAMEDILQDTGASRDKMAVIKLDLSSLKSIRSFAEEFKRSEKRLDILINNAGVVWPPEDKTEDGFEFTFGVNHLGHFLLTNLLLDIMKESAPSRIVVVSTHGHFLKAINLTDVMQFNDFEAYTHSKTANILFSKQLAKILEGTGVTTYSVHPGTAHSEMGRSLKYINYPVVKQIVYIIMWPFIKSSEEGAQTSICCAVDESLAQDTGKYYSDCAEYEPAPHASDMEVADKLWTLSAQLVGMKT